MRAAALPRPALSGGRGPRAASAATVLSGRQKYAKNMYNFLSLGMYKNMHNWMYICTTSCH